MPKENFNLAAMHASVPEEIRQKIVSNRPSLAFHRDICRSIASGIVAALVLECDVMLLPNPMKQTVWRHRGCGGIVESELAYSDSDRDYYFPVCQSCHTQLEHSKEWTACNA